LSDEIAGIFVVSAHSVQSKTLAGQEIDGLQRTYPTLEMLQTCEKLLERAMGIEPTS
jgi:hypothetical protein